MSMFKRVSQVFQQKSNALLDKVEDPTQAIDLSYEKMQENLQQVRRSIADVLTSQKRLEAQRAQLQAQYDKLQGQARQALQQGQEDVA
ncbi:MAG: PspA/IM30 family protein [Ferrimicrobium acidiphilum]